MVKGFKVNIFKNKSNGQFNFSIPKKKLSKKMLFNLSKAKKMKINIEKLYS